RHDELGNVLFSDVWRRCGFHHAAGPKDIRSRTSASSPTCTARHCHVLVLCLSVLGGETCACDTERAGQEHHPDTDLARRVWSGDSAVELDAGSTDSEQ